jgi:hypothetical protein
MREDPQEPFCLSSIHRRFHPRPATLGNEAFLSPMGQKNKCKVYLDLNEGVRWDIPEGQQLVTRTEAWQRTGHSTNVRVEWAREVR